MADRPLLKRFRNGEVTTAGESLFQMPVSWDKRGKIICLRLAK
jgi:hypothetical protein